MSVSSQHMFGPLLRSAQRFSYNAIMYPEEAQQVRVAAFPPPHILIDFFLNSILYDENA